MPFSCFYCVSVCSCGANSIILSNYLSALLLRFHISYLCMDMFILVFCVYVSFENLLEGTFSGHVFLTASSFCLSWKIFIPPSICFTG
jgi:hypothetical protein